MSILSGFLMPHPPIIIPEIGKGEEYNIKDTTESMNSIGKMIKELKPDTIVVITPHGNLFRDAVAINYDRNLAGDFGSFGHKTIKLEFSNNIKIVDEIIKEADKEGLSAIKIDDALKKDFILDSRLDHGVLVPLYFVKKYYCEFDLIHITYGLLTNEELYRFGQCMQKALNNLNSNVVIIASGDLSHKLTKEAPSGYSPDGKVFDEKILEYLSDNRRLEIMTFDNSLAERAGQCGLKSIQIMIGALDGLKTTNNLLSYEGPFGVGYGCVEMKVVGELNDMFILKKIIENNRYWIKKLRDKEDEYVNLARTALETYVKENKTIKPQHSYHDKSLLSERKGVFVSIKQDGDLRGCIGTIEPTKKNISEEIITNAISAGIYDPRFKQVTVEELPTLIYSVDILSFPEKIHSNEMLDPFNYGVIVTNGRKKGLLLPNIEGVETVEEQLRIALKKAGINKWESYQIERFRVERHH